jgi:hypothetical protein
MPGGDAGTRDSGAGEKTAPHPRLASARAHADAW